MDTIDYLAGFFDGDGSLVLGKYSKGLIYHAAIAQKDPDVLYEFQKGMKGLGRVVEGKGGFTGNPCFYWRVTRREELKKFLTLVGPFLRTEKQKKSRLLLRMVNLRGVSGQKVSEEVKRKRRKILRDWTRIKPSFRGGNISLSYLAGLIDAEATAFRSSRNQLTVVVYQLNLEMLKSLKTQFNTGSLQTDSRNGVGRWKIKSKPLLSRLLPLSRKIYVKEAGRP